jgi:NADH dehydrogenase (ubiquinone) Fe-S protein 6
VEIDSSALSVKSKFDILRNSGKSSCSNTQWGFISLGLEPDPARHGWKWLERSEFRFRPLRYTSIDNMLSAARLVSRRSYPLRIISRSATSSSETSSSSTSVAKLSASTPVRAPQAPNYPAKWSTNQRARPVGGESPRFEQTAMDLQPQPLSAMEMINAEPVRVVHGRKAVCDGGESLGIIGSLIFSATSHCRRRPPWTPKDFYQLGALFSAPCAASCLTRNRRISQVLVLAGMAAVLFHLMRKLIDI